jgi:hypothetical protein
MLAGHREIGPCAAAFRVIEMSPEIVIIPERGIACLRVAEKRQGCVFKPHGISVRPFCQMLLHLPEGHLYVKHIPFLFDIDIYVFDIKDLLHQHAADALDDEGIEDLPLLRSGLIADVDTSFRPGNGGQKWRRVAVEECGTGFMISLQPQYLSRFSSFPTVGYYFLD